MEDFVSFLMLIFVGMFVGYFLHVALMIRVVYRMRSVENAVVHEPHTVYLEKHESIFLVYDSEYRFLTQDTSLLDALLVAIGEQSSVRVLVVDDELKNEVTSILSEVEKDIDLSTIPSQTDTHRE